MTKLTSNIVRYIEHELSHYEFYKAELLTERGRIFDKSSNNAYSPLNTGARGSSTEAKALRLFTSLYIKRLEDTVSAIERLISRLSEEHLEFFKEFYAKNMNMVDASIELNLSKETIYRRRKAVIDLAAYEFGFLSEFSID